MKYIELEELLSPKRLGRYNAACNDHILKTMSLYQANIRLSQTFFGVLSIFEVVLRNKIDSHYRSRFSVVNGMPEWLLQATLLGGFLTTRGCQFSLEKITQAYVKLGPAYTHDKLLVSLSFGFWKHMFAGKQYHAGGDTLLAIFPNFPPRRNQGFIYQKLHLINSIRNRIAHHEPICFGPGNIIDTTYARAHYKEMTDILTYMNIDSAQLFAGHTGVLETANYIDSI